jgi:hypothetical protein
MARTLCEESVQTKLLSTQIQNSSSISTRSSKGKPSCGGQSRPVLVLDVFGLKCAILLSLYCNLDINCEKESMNAQHFSVFAIKKIRGVFSLSLSQNVRYIPTAKITSC